MKYTLLAAVAAAMMIGSGPALAEILIEHPAYAYQTAPQQKNGVIFLGLRNTGESAVSVTAVTTDIADKLELHSVSTDGGMMQMREVDSFLIPAGGDLTLEPMGNHIMVMGLHEPLQLDATFPLTIKLDNGDALQTEVTIVKPGFTHASNPDH